MDSCVGWIVGTALPYLVTTNSGDWKGGLGKHFQHCYHLFDQPTCITLSGTVKEPPIVASCAGTPCLIYYLLPDKILYN